MRHSFSLPWPPRELSPNARCHYMRKANLAKHYKADCGWLAKQAKLVAPEEGEIMIDLTFLPPDNRRRDLDNMLSSAKLALDSLADAMGVNDYRFAFTIRRGDPVKHGSILVQIG